MFSEVFGGFFLDQKICKGCEHTYDREESFLSLSLPVKSKTLEEALKEFVKGDMLEGDNAYLCEKCQEKVCMFQHPFTPSSIYHFQPLLPFISLLSETPSRGLVSKHYLQHLLSN